VQDIKMNLEKHPELLDSLAASYALGTMRGLARRRLETQAREHPAIRAALLLWQERMASITEIQNEVTPSPNVWKRIELALNLETQSQDSVQVLDENPGVKTSRSVSQVLNNSLEEVRRALSWWRGAALASAVVAVLSLFIASPWQSSPELQFVAVLADDQSAATLLVSYDAKGNALHLKRVGQYREAADKSLQLWALPPGAAPRSLGVLGADKDLKLALTGRQDFAVPMLAVSLEPKGGVPSEKGPTGPVLFKGLVAKF
jgi:anti-sigma-K factor RskA